MALYLFKCIWQIFLFARLNLPNVLISVAKKFFFSHSDFPFPCFDVPKPSNFTSGGVKNRETKSRGLGTVVTSIQDFKPREKQITPGIDVAFPLQVRSSSTSFANPFVLPVVSQPPSQGIYPAMVKALEKRFVVSFPHVFSLTPRYILVVCYTVGSLWVPSVQFSSVNHQ